MTEPTPSPSKPKLPWRRRLHYRLIMAYGFLFIIVLTLLMVLVVNTVYDVQMNQAEHNLEVQALLAAKALEDPMSGYSGELEEYERRESQQAEDDDDHNDEDDEDDHNDEDGGSGDEDNSTKGAARIAAASSDLVPSPVDEPSMEGLQHLADRYADQSNLWVTIFDMRGDPVVDSHRAPETISNQLNAPEIQAAMRLVEQHDIRADPATGTSYLFAAAPVQIGDQLFGVVRMAQPMTDVMAPIRTLARNLLLAGLAALILATVPAIAVAHRLVQPIRRLEETALAVAGGDLSQTADIRSQDEIGSLARTFDYMVGELQEMMRRQRLFIANASHELRTPLTNIKLRSEALLALDGEEPVLTARYLREIDSEADRLARLATSLLDLSKIENRQPSGSRTPVDVQPMLLDVVRSMRMRMRDANLTFSARIAEDLPRLAVRPADLETIVLNLLDNAVKYTPAGGTVGLIAETKTRQGGTQVAVTVRDSGPGIPADDVDHIFEYFYRVDKARGRQSTGLGSGAGLGLAIVNTLVEQNNGSISVSSQEHQGTSFTVTFPAVAASA